MFFAQLHVYLPWINASLAQRLNSVLYVKARVDTFNHENLQQNRSLLCNCERKLHRRFVKSSIVQDDILHPRYRLLSCPPELEAAGAAVSGQKPDIVHARAAVVADVVARVQVTRALAPPLPRLKTKILIKFIQKYIKSQCWM